jgi:hypothetical protein
MNANVDLTPTPPMKAAAKAGLKMVADGDGKDVARGMVTRAQRMSRGAALDPHQVLMMHQEHKRMEWDPGYGTTDPHVTADVTHMLRGGTSSMKWAADKSHAMGAGCCGDRGSMITDGTTLSDDNTMILKGLSLEDAKTARVNLEAWKQDKLAKQYEAQAPAPIIHPENEPSEDPNAASQEQYPKGGQAQGRDQRGIRFSIFLAEDSQPEEADGKLITKVALRTGTWLMSPGADGKKVMRPLKIVKGHSDLANNVLGMQDLVDSVDDRAFDHVTVPLSHNDRPEENTGEVKRAWIEEDADRPGEAVLKLASEFTEPDIEGKVRRGSIRNNSVGVIYDHVRNSDGKKFVAALKHMALTNKPWINGLQPFGLAASEDKAVGEQIDELVGIPIEQVDVGQLASEEEGSTELTTNQDTSTQEGGENVSDKNEKDAPIAEQVSVEEFRALQLQLSEANALISAQQATQESLQRTVHTKSVDEFIGDCNGAGLGVFPGMLKKARQIMLEDDGGPVMSLNLSEDQAAEPKELTASGIVKTLLDALPRNEQGKLHLSDQAFDGIGLADESRPPVKTPEVEGQDTRPVEERAAEAAKELGLPYSKVGA